MEVRWLLVHLGELGLGEQVAREFQISRTDLYQLAMIEAECRALAAPPNEERNGEGRSS